RQRTTRFANQLIAQRHHDYAEFAVKSIPRMVHSNPSHDGVQVCLCLRQNHAWLQARNDLQIVSVTIGELLLVERERHPQTHIVFEKVKTRRHYADDRVLFSIQKNLAIDDIAVPAVTTLPEAIAKHRDFVSAGTILLGKKTTAKQRLH